MLSFEDYRDLPDEICQERINAARKQLGSRAVLLCHH